MICIGMHATLREGCMPNPVHAPIGLEENITLADFLLMFDTPRLFWGMSINFIGVGVGTRFEEMLEKEGGIGEKFSHVAVEYYELLGIGASRRNGIVTTPMGTQVPESRYHRSAESFSCESLWDEFLGQEIKNAAKGDILLLAGAAFVEALGAPCGHYGNSLIEVVDLENRLLSWRVKHGQLLDAPEPIPCKQRVFPKPRVLAS